MNLPGSVVAACCAMLGGTGEIVHYTDGDQTWRATRLDDGYEFRLVGTPNSERNCAQAWIDVALPFDD